MRGSRPYRRFVSRRFSGTGSCVAWLFTLALTIYVLDSYVLTTQLMLDIVGDERSAARQPGDGSTSVRISSVANNVSKIHSVAGIAGAAEHLRKDNETYRVDQQLRCSIHCDAKQISYHVKSGEGHDGSPVVCLNGEYVLGRGGPNGARGLNVVVVDNVTLRVVDVKAFDVYRSDDELQRYLMRGVSDGHVVVAATMDDAANSLTDAGRKVLEGYGSVLITMLGFRDNFVMIGQKGLEVGRANEKLLAREDGRKFAESVQIGGCLDLPLGSLTGNVFGSDGAAKSAPGLGQDLPNCGVQEPCGNDSFSVQLFTGYEDKWMAKMCVDGKYVFAEGLNDAGRGLNMAVVKPTSRTVARVGHFDTYAKDSSSVEFFMEMLAEGDIVVVVTYDDASKNLDSAAQELFRTLGSSYADSLSFRDAWVFVGQHGIDGYSGIEALSPRTEGHWPEPIDMRVCVPTVLRGSKERLKHPFKPKII